MMKVAVIDVIDPSSVIRNREVKLFQKICETGEHAGPL